VHVFFYVRQNYYPWAINTMEGDSAHHEKAWCPGDAFEDFFYDLYICSSRWTCENDPIWHGELVKISQRPRKQTTHFLAHVQLQRSLHFLRSRLKKLPKAKKTSKLQASMLGVLEAVTTDPTGWSCMPFFYLYIHHKHSNQMTVKI